MNHPARRRKIATERKRAQASTRRTPHPITLAGIDELPTSDLEPGAPDAVDLAETARPMSPGSAKEIALAAGGIEQDEKPLATTEKVLGRDEQRWELDPASSEDFEERQRTIATEPRRRRQR